MTEVDRGVLRSLFEQWSSGEVDEREVHEAAQRIRDSDDNWPEYPKHDPRSIAVEVLTQLDLLNHQLITREDIPTILEFLDTPAGAESDGWERWRDYWAEADLGARSSALQDDPYYCT